ncbi:hypothetical protein J3R83DRAFT_8608 [Lanmaoa asiatica]|nr:hypothetical protein J3R83DRAFT_8608 [Lanmaoa asiatica]
MDLDDAATQPARRASSAHDRPTRAPFGPRIRTRQKHSADMATPGPPSADGPASPLFSSTTSSRPDSPGVDFTALSIDASFARPLLPEQELPPLSPPAHADAAVQTPSTTPLPELSPSPSPSPSPASPPSAQIHPSRLAISPQKSATTTFIAPPPLTPPPAITFEPTPIPWKGLPLEAAQWTFSSSELQEIVSKAIRLSARESFVRLLSLQALEVDIVQESERLDAERAAAQAKWRFEVGRRTMLMQALNSSAASSAPNGSSNGTGAGASENGGGNPITGFIGQLASSIASCDSLLSSILHFSDQQSQIALIQHQHWASALGVALRKLNRAHERQAQELKSAQTRVQTLEDELEEAWREAEKMAIEFDGPRGGGRSEWNRRWRWDVDANGEGHVADPGPGIEAKQDPDETGTLGDVTINTDIAVVLGVTATAVASKATLVASPNSPEFADNSDAKSVRSVKSTRSRRSTRDGPNHSCCVQCELTTPEGLRSVPSTRTPPVNAPPIPALPQGHSFLDMGNFGHEQVQKALPPQRSCCLSSFSHTCSRSPFQFSIYHRTGHPEPTLALPTPPHSAGLPPTRVPSIWLETDGGKSTRLNGLDRTHSLQIFSSLTSRTPRKSRRSNLVMSLTGSDRSSEAGCVPRGGWRLGYGHGEGRRDRLADLQQFPRLSPHTRTRPFPPPESYLVPICHRHDAETGFGGCASDDDEGHADAAADGDAEAVARESCELGDFEAVVAGDDGGWE